MSGTENVVQIFKQRAAGISVRTPGLVVGTDGRGACKRIIQLWQKAPENSNSRKPKEREIKKLQCQPHQSSKETKNPKRNAKIWPKVRNIKRWAT